MAEKPPLSEEPLFLIEVGIQGSPKKRVCSSAKKAEEQTCSLDAVEFFWDTAGILEKHASLDVS